MFTSLKITLIILKKGPSIDMKGIFPVVNKGDESVLVFFLVVVIMIMIMNMNMILIIMMMMMMMTAY